MLCQFRHYFGYDNPAANQVEDAGCNRLIQEPAFWQAIQTARKEIDEK